MKLENVFEVDERGVSPVIGVILMVAITVILAAVIGAFVLDLGSQLGSTGPTSQLAISDSSASIAGNDAAIVDVEHKGGDDLKTSDLKVIVEAGGSTYTDTDISNGWDGGALAYSSTPSEFTVGDSLQIKEASTELSSGEMTIKIVHKPSNSVVATSTVDVS